MSDIEDYETEFPMHFVSDNHAIEDWEKKHSVLSPAAILALFGFGILVGCVLVVLAGRLAEVIVG